MNLNRITIEHNGKKKNSITIMRNGVKYELNMFKKGFMRFTLIQKYSPVGKACD